MPFVTTVPDLKEDRWGSNGNTWTLTNDRLRKELSAVFEGEFPDCRHDWHSDPNEMPDQVMRLLPPSVMVLAEFDVLYDSQINFINRLLAQAVTLD